MSQSGKSSEGLGNKESDNEQQERLLDACENGRLVEVKELIEGGCVTPTLCQTNPHHDSLLHIAAKRGHKSIVKYLVEQAKYDAESRNKFQKTLLHRAAREGQIDVVKYLIEERNCNPMCECH